MTSAQQQYFEKHSEINKLIASQGAADHLTNNKLYKIYLLCPKLTNHVFINQTDRISFLASFRDYFNRAIEEQNILFEEDEPHHHHQFSQHGTGLLVLLAPPNLIVCLDSRLLLQTDQIICECIVGVYLSAEDEKIFTSSHFNMETIRQWIVKDQDSESGYKL
ncbi:MAG: hypothetical protein EXR81_02205 [Gammaproteobacteria bacterium]|nr:hypothetical protein [Gammaproteobacteria bacterium]